MAWKRVSGELESSSKRSAQDELVDVDESKELPGVTDWLRHSRGNIYGESE